MPVGRIRHDAIAASGRVVADPDLGTQDAVSPLFAASGERGAGAEDRDQQHRAQY